ncbi:methylmalonyl-CoA epimerase [Zunongwangia endophytica]|uniref:Methylmalonyl-CoA epimerase n=1 Tax=Zunongwangia endophytica TaxID=1808945 RepID=A0ABV8H379_9FLAO|nr:methylmalonyl-CoA epimerase [Zunongwangia endophytica]MDN3595962.1 methylmalonyl-CoA epimerase [Zunongwangia endophytica]
MKKIEHIGIAVSDLEAANKTYAAVMGKSHYKTEEVQSEQVITSFFEIGESKVELLAATSNDSALAKSILKRGEGLHHIAFAVDNIEAEIERLQSEGFRLLNDQPKKGADNKLIAFMHPKEANGVLIELCQEIQ